MWLLPHFFMRDLLISNENTSATITLNIYKYSTFESNITLTSVRKCVYVFKTKSFCHTPLGPPTTTGTVTQTPTATGSSNV